MDDNDEIHLSGKTIISPVYKTDENEEPSHFEDIPNTRDGRTASPDSVDADHDDIQLLEDQRS